MWWRRAVLPSLPSPLSVFFFVARHWAREGVLLIVVKFFLCEIHARERLLAIPNNSNTLVCFGPCYNTLGTGLLVATTDGKRQEELSPLTMKWRAGREDAASLLLIYDGLLFRAIAPTRISNDSCNPLSSSHEPICATGGAVTHASDAPPMTSPASSRASAATAMLSTVKKTGVR